MEQDMTDAIAHLRRGLSLAQPGTRRHGQLLNTLGCAFLVLGRYSRRREDFDESIRILDELALNGLTRSFEDTESLYNLASARFDRFRTFHVCEDREILVSNLRRACDSPYGTPYARFVAAKFWATIFHRPRASSDDLPTMPRELKCALEAYERCIQLLPQIAGVGLSIEWRLAQLSTLAQSIASDAAACAITLSELDPSSSREMLERAVELLDHGRSVVWTQAVQFRENIEGLRDREPEIADKFRSLADTLSSSGIGIAASMGHIESSAAALDIEACECVGR